VLVIATMRSELEKNTIVVRIARRRANEMPPGLIEHLRFAAGRDQRRDLILANSGDKPNVLVHSQFDRQSFPRQ